MTVTYDLSTLIGQVRLKTGDNKILAPVFTDEEIQVFLDENSDSVALAAATLLESWAAQYAINVDSEKIGDYSYSQSIVNKLLSMAKALRDSAAASPEITWSEMNLADSEDGE